MIARLLIANRGEIACRIMATAQAHGIICIAVYARADRDARHVRLADVAVPIGGDAPADSYLDGARIVQAALDTGADAIHPGYGFLSENADFAEAVTQAGLMFVGPSAKAIRDMGQKDRAKTLMEAAGVPVVPGYHGADQDPAVLAGHANTIGCPVIIKAVAGGGKGMRIVRSMAEFDAALASAQAEARTAFGNDAVLIEKYITAPRHIEVQIFADGTDVVHLYERDCSLQRRHQKVIEEAPAPGMTAPLRAAMCAAAVRAAKAIGYRGAGTVEFIVDASGPLRADGFWFMEMNTRLQVEHPVTEAITGIDLVDWQLQVAQGAPLPASQSKITCTGHAIEARLYAEDPAKDFLPVSGPLHHLEFPTDLRIEAGVEAGDRISPHYDPMIAKLIAQGPDRATALARLARGLARTHVAGITTNLAFLGAPLRHDDVVAGRLDTGLIAREAAPLTAAVDPTAQDLAQAALVLCGLMGPPVPGQGFALHSPLDHPLTVMDTQMTLRVLGADAVDITIADQSVAACRRAGHWRFDGVAARPYHHTGQTMTLFGATDCVLWQRDPLDRTAVGPGGNVVLSPMPGLVRDVCVTQGDVVQEGAPLAKMEAMKMEHILRAPRAGTIGLVHAVAGSQVAAGVALITLEDADAG